MNTKANTCFKLIRISMLLALFCVSDALLAQEASSDCGCAVDVHLQRIYIQPDSFPVPVLGMDELMHRLAVEVETPPIDDLTVLGPKTLVSFVVSETGEIQDKQVIKEQFPNSNVAEQIFKIVESMEWKPGICKGNPVPTEFVLPLKICLN